MKKKTKGKVLITITSIDDNSLVLNIVFIFEARICEELKETSLSISRLNCFHHH